MHHLSISLLRSFDVTLDGKPIPRFDSDKTRALLAYLAVESDRPHRRETLAGLLWPDRPERNARQSLSQALYTLREVLGERESAVPLLHATHQTVHLAPNESLCVDVPDFLHLLEQCPQSALRQTPCRNDICSLRQAADLYRSDLLPGFTLADSAPFEEWLLLQRERLHRLALEMLQRLVGCCEARGDLEGATQYAWRWVELEPWHEGAHRALMRLLALSGERASALAQYDTCARILRDELDAEPSPETQQLYEAIRDGSDLTGLRAADLSGPVDVPRHNLPAQVTSFIGRDGELAALGALLVEPKPRLVTVVGAGGMGKTRLAIEVGRETLGTAFDEAWLVELAPIPDDASVPRAVARALGVQEGTERPLPESIALSLRTRNLLLVVDNCEHVVDGAAALVDLLLARCPDLTVLATSREPLHVAGEHLYEAQPMALPERNESTHDLIGSDAVQLFGERAAAVRPEFVLGEETVSLVFDICRHLDGMPLAIELAAARLRALSIRDIARQLDDRFRLLTGGSRAALPRQRTLRNTVEWSYHLLDEVERLLFDRLSVFAGSFSLEAAMEVCSGEGVEKRDILDLLSALVDKSLVSTLQGLEGEIRYRLLETLRAYGQARLEERGDADEMARRHAWYYVTLIETEEPRLLNSEQALISALAHLDVETENLAAAMRWSMAHEQFEVVIRIGGPSWHWAVHRPHWAQYVEWLRQALLRGREVAALYRAKALSHVFWFDMSMRRNTEAVIEAQEALEMALVAEAPRWIGLGHLWMGIAAQIQGDPERARDHFEESLAIAREIDDRALIGFNLTFSTNGESLDKRRVVLEEWLPLAPRYQKPWLQMGLANDVWSSGDLATAEALLLESYRGWTPLGDNWALGMTSLQMINVVIWRGDYDRAERLLARGSAWAHQSGNYNAIFTAYETGGLLAWACQDQERAAFLLEEGLALARESGRRLNEAWVQCLLALVACEESRYGDVEALCNQAIALTPEQVHGICHWIFLAMGRAALLSSESARAVDLDRQALDHARYGEARLDATMTLECLAWALAADEQIEEAARLLAMVARERDEMGVVLFPIDRPHHEKAMETVRRALGEEAFAAAWAEGEALSLDEAVARALGEDVS